MGSPTKESESLVGETWFGWFVSGVSADTWNPQRIRGAHPPSLNTTRWPIVEQYCEGKVKRTPGGEWNRTWNLMFTSTQSTLWVRCGTFCRMVRRVYVCSEVKNLRFEAVGKPSVNSAIVACIRPETGWPIHGQVEAEVKFRGGPNSLLLKK